MDDLSDRVSEGLPRHYVPSAAFSGCLSIILVAYGMTCSRTFESSFKPSAAARKQSTPLAVSSPDAMRAKQDDQGGLPEPPDEEREEDGRSKLRRWRWLWKPVKARSRVRWYRK